MSEPRARHLALLPLLLLAPSACTLDLEVGTRAAAPVPPVVGTGNRVDLLFVVDNSASMCDNQDLLVDAFFDPSCPIQDLNMIPASFQNPTDDLAMELSEVCGFSQMLAAYDADFRVGVITTDVGQCDNRFGLAGNSVFQCRSDEGWGRRPQRGCLQAPESWGGRKYLRRSDGAVGRLFSEAVASVGVYGSAYERGLDAVDIFLDPEAETAAGCEDDSTTFLRDDAQLIVVFVTDEDDCSHMDGALGFPDENEGEDCSHATEDPPEPKRYTELCLGEGDVLAPVETYTARWRARMGDRMSVLLLGGVANEGGELRATGCSYNEGYSETCHASGGMSNLTMSGAPCDPEVLAAEGIEVACCEADPAPRYMQLVNAMGSQSTAESICGGPDFRASLDRIRQLFVAR
jgi:hypothetical protein